MPLDHTATDHTATDHTATDHTATDHAATLASAARLVADALSADDYLRARPQYRSYVLRHKERRRVRLGPNAVLLFESYETATYQLHEVLHAEGRTPTRLAREASEYAKLVALPGELRATLLVDGNDTRVCRGIAQRCTTPGAVMLQIGRCRVASRPVERHADPQDPIQYLRFQLGSDARLALSDASSVVHVVLADSLGPRCELPPLVRSALADDACSRASQTRIADFVPAFVSPSSTTQR
ncbi:MAG: DUF3501 family protein [Nannocystaceae bacterium]|nr:DUF3501 family protein [Nannocystaceae bacterium]